MDGEIIITPRQLAQKHTLVRNICLNRNAQKVITGTLFDPMGNPISNALIQLTRRGTSQSMAEFKEEGYVMTDCDGMFAIVIEQKEDVDYELKIYSPMIYC